ncbi:uncharacterized protein LOC121056020 [Oryza brachyantha]|uniref:uncharacterized protein LOC121056020 n=1 Tax=Oryza brachyantha TaxID=4533 RepID=UPI001AD99ED9|nr:uncharacterized protein LOC121056020 [Oryza brachyantha]
MMAPPPPLPGQGSVQNNKERQNFINSRKMEPLKPRGEHEDEEEEVSTKKDWKFQFLPRPAASQMSYKFRYPVTPSMGHFIVELQPPAHLARDVYKPIKILFRSRDLYVLGFLHGNLWCLTRDVEVGDNDRQWVHYLPFHGGYGDRGLDCDHSTVKLGSEGMMDSYLALSHYNPMHQNPGQVIRAVQTLVGNISEPARFLSLQRRAMKAFKEQETQMVKEKETQMVNDDIKAAPDNEKDEQQVYGKTKAHTDSSAMFTKWQSFCNYVRGRGTFLPSPCCGIYSLEDVFSELGIMLRDAANA